MKEEIIKEQKLICQKYSFDWVESLDNMKVGISKNIKDGVVPVNGLRHEIEGDTTGWYIWGGEEFSNDPNFFVPLHVEHLDRWCPQVLKYLGLPPGTRFLIKDNYEDIWEDKTLLKI